MRCEIKVNAPNPSLLKRGTKGEFLIFLLFVFFIPALQAITLSVGPNDKIQGAIDKTKPGDIVIIKDGVYKETIDLDEKTSITVKAEGKNAVITGVKNGIVIDNCSNVVIDGFIIKDVPRRGIFAVDSDSVTIKNCEISNSGDLGILTGFCSYLLIENNEVYNTKGSHGIYVSNSSDYPIVRNNTCYDNADSGIQLNADIHTQPLEGGADGIITNAVIENNILYGNNIKSREAFALNFDGVQHSLIRNNMLYDNHGGGIVLFKIDGGDSSKFNRISNNTVYYSTGENFVNQIPLSIVDDSTGCIVENNIFVTDGAIPFELEENTAFYITSDNNVFYNRADINSVVWIKNTAESREMSDYWRHYDIENAIKGKTYSLPGWQKFNSQDLRSITEKPLFVNPQK